MPPTPRLGRAPPAFASRRVGCDADRLFSCPSRIKPMRVMLGLRPKRSRAARIAHKSRLASKPRKRKEKMSADDAGRDLDDKPHWRVREHGIASPFVDTGVGVSRCCPNARVAQALLPMPDDGVAVSVSISIRPLARHRGVKTPAALEAAIP